MKYSVLGPVEVRHDAGQVALRAAKQRMLLAVLLCQANTPVSVDRLIHLLWGASPPRTAHENLRLYVYQLRRALGDPHRIARRSPGYTLIVGCDELDAHCFEQLASEGEAALAAGDPSRAAAALSDGLALWRGQAYACLDEVDLLREEAGRLEERRRAALEARVEADLALGRHREVIAELTRLVRQYPLIERLRAQLMLALYRSGRQAESLGVYRDTRRLLADELGLEPSAELRQLEQAILTGGSMLDPAVRTSIAAGRATASRPVPRLLCADVGDFVGRREQLDVLDRLFAPAETTCGDSAAGHDGKGEGFAGGPPGTAAVITAIVGTPGVGKTALAVHWAHRARDRFPDGQLYLNLRGYSSGAPVEPIEALAVFLRALGVPAEQVPAEVNEAAGLYRSVLADRRMLVLLDNVRSVEQVRPLLPAAPGCRVLITSRDRLGGLVARHGARRMSLGVLSPAEAHALLTSILGADRVTREPHAVQALTRACAHLPLALRISAANLLDDGYRSIADEVAELTDGNRLTALEVDDDEDAAVRAAFDLSYTRLPSDAQRLFRLLGLVPGPDVAATAVASLAGIPIAAAGRLLGRLAGAHLIEQHAPGRYAFHDLLRLYAAELAHQHDREPDRVAALERLYGDYLYTCDAAARLLYPEKVRLPLPEAPAGTSTSFDDNGQALAWFDAESANLVASVTGPPPGLPNRWVWLLADVLRGFLLLRVYPDDIRLAIANAGLAAARAEGDAQAQAVAYLSLGRLHRRQGRHGLAAEHYSTMLRLSRQVAWLPGQAAALGTLGTTCWWAGRLQEAVTYLSESQAIAEQTGQVGLQAINLGNLARVYFEQGLLTDALDHARQAVARYRQLKSRGAEAVSLSNTGVVLHALGRLDEALDHLAQAVALHREMGDRGNEADSLPRLAAVHRDSGDLGAARELASLGLSLSVDTGEPRFEAQALNALATIEHRLGDHAHAGSRHREALHRARDAANRYSEVEALLGIAITDLHAGDHVGAGSHVRQALMIAEQAGYGLLQRRAHSVLDEVEQAGVTAS